MITIRKLARLAANTRRRKIVRLLEGFERDRVVPQTRYLAGIVELLVRDDELPEDVRDAARAADEAMRPPDAAGDEEATLRALDTVRHLLMRHLGVESADWDLLGPAGVRGGASEVAAGPPHPDAAPGSEGPGLAAVSVYLESIRSPFNMGSIVRTASAFGAGRVGVSADCPPVDHPRVVRSAMGAMKYIGVERDGLDAFAARWGGPVVALELGGEPVGSFAFPERGVLVLGSEELGLSPAALRRADARVTIPTPGAKASLNVGVACGIALAAWLQALRAGERSPTRS